MTVHHLCAVTFSAALTYVLERCGFAFLLLQLLQLQLLAFLLFRSRIVMVTELIHEARNHAMEMNTIVERRCQ